MTKRSHLLTAAATAITLLAFGGTANADENADITDEVTTCIAEVAGHANYEDATLVRHLVTKQRRSRRGYVLTIDTSVFTDGDDAIREYASFCISRGANKLVKFTIDEVSA